MIQIRQYHIRIHDVITGVLRASAPPEVPLHIYLSQVNMTAFIRSIKSTGARGGYMFGGVVVFGRHPAATIESNVSGFVASEVIPFIRIEENVDVKA